MQGQYQYANNQTQPQCYNGQYVMVGNQSTQMTQQPYVMNQQGGSIPQPQIVNQPQVGTRVQYVFVEDPIFELSTAVQAIVIQQVELFEMITGCETKNRYHVQIKNEMNQIKYLFLCKEESGYCARNCCKSEARPFDMKVKHVNGQVAMNGDFSSPFVIFRKPCKCVCCCCCRPEMTGNIEETGESLGKIKQPYTCCDPLFVFYDPNNTPLYTITTTCCQCGICCRNDACGKLSEVSFSILEGDGNTKKQVGEICKKVTGLQDLYTDADTFVITFPTSAKPFEKLMLIGVTLMIDYTFFEDNGSNGRHGHYGYYGHYHGGIHIRV